MHTSSVAPGYTVDSYTTMAPFFMYLPTLSLDFTSGVKSGWWASSTGVGTATMMKSASEITLGSVLQVRCTAALRSSLLTSPVGSTWRA